MTADNIKKSSQEKNFPRPGSLFFNLVYTEQTGIPSSIKWFRRLNKLIVIPLYRTRILPLFGAGRIFLLLNTKGRKSGKRRRTPLEFHRINGKIHIISSRGENADWVKNIRKNPDDIYIQVGFRSFHIKPIIIENKSEIEDFFKWYSVNHANAAKTGYGWDPKHDNPETADFSILAQKMTLVRIEIPL